MEISFQMLEVAIGWEVYSLHRSALDLGFIGLAEFVPMLLFALPAGQLADRLPAPAGVRGRARVSARSSAAAWPWSAGPG